MKITHQSGIGEIQIEMLAQPAAEFDRRPVPLAGQRRIINERQDVLPDRFRGNAARASRAGTVSDAVNPLRVEAFDPFLKAPLAHTGMAQGEIETASTKQQMNRVETLVGFLIRTAVNGQLQLRNGAGFVIRELAGTSDSQ